MWNAAVIVTVYYTFKLVQLIEFFLLFFIKHKKTNQNRIQHIVFYVYSILYTCIYHESNYIVSKLNHRPTFFCFFAQ